MYVKHSILFHVLQVIMKTIQKFQNSDDCKWHAVNIIIGNLVWLAWLAEFKYLKV